MTLDNLLQFSLSAVWAVLVFSGILTLAALMTWVERKLSAMIQDRIGPNRANIRIGKYNFTLIGLLHIAADPVKLFTKEDFTPKGAHKILHPLAPMIGLVVPIVVFVLLPFAGPITLHFKENIPAEQLPVLGWLIGHFQFTFPHDWLKAIDGWFIDNDINLKLLLGSEQVLHQKMIAASTWLQTSGIEQPFKAVWGGDVLHLKSLTIHFTVMDVDPGILLVLALSSLAVYSIILAGWASNNKFSFLGSLRGANQMISYEVALGLCLIGIIMIYGGVSFDTIVKGQGDLLLGIIPKWGIVTQPLAFLLFFTCGMAEIKRVPFDLPEGESEIIAGYMLEYSSLKFTMFMFGEFVEMILLSGVITTLFLGGWQIPFIDANGWHILSSSGLWADTWVGTTFGSNGTQILVALLQAGKFTLTLLAVLYSIFMMRWTYPRFRYDQIMKMGWKMVMPLALINIVVTGVVLAFTRGMF